MRSMLPFVTIPYAHPVLEALGLLVGMQFYRHLKRRSVDPIPGAARFWIVVAAGLGAAAGSRASAGLETWLGAPELVSGVPGVCASGKSIIGGMLGGLFAVEGAKLRLKVRRSSGDLFVFPILLGLIVGRIGCFAGGLEDCTYGVRTTFPWGIDFGDGIARHPMQLYEIAFLLVTWSALRRFRGAEGAQFKCLMVAYLAFRFVVDFWKPMIPLGTSGLAATQVLCLVGLAWYVAVYAYSRVKVSAQ